MTLWDEIRTVAVILIMLLLPGWALLSVGQYWKRWQPLQRWFLALSLGIAVYPVMFYVSRAILPELRIGLWKLVIFLVVSLIIIVWNLRYSWREHLRFEKLSLLALLVLFVTMNVRLIIAHQHPFLAGDDSLHHTLITELTSLYGQLPFTLEPYDNTVLDHYHLGLYALTAPLKLLTGLRSDQALLWMCQFLNGVAGIGTFLFLDRLLTRKSAIAGLAFVGLLCVFPNYYVNWGRFTQLAGQVLLFPAAVIYWDHLTRLKLVNATNSRLKIDWLGISFTGLVAGAVCLLHFRVAAFLVPLMLMIFIVETLVNRERKAFPAQKISQTLLIILVVLVIILPALVPGLRAYIEIRAPQPRLGEEAPAKKMSENPYYTKGDGTTNQLTEESKWLYLVCFIGILLGLLKSKSKQLSLILILWLLVFLAITFAYLTNIGLLAIMNRTAVLLALYMPFSIGLGLLVFVSEQALPESKLSVFVFLGVMFVSMWSIKERLMEYRPKQEFMTEADLRAMDWIKQNTPEDSVIGANTGFLNPAMPFGTDAGYWILFYSQRETTTLTLLSSLTENQESYDISRANAIIDVYGSSDALVELCTYNVSYLYSGAKPALSKNQFDFLELLKQPGTELVYDQDGVQILEICTNQ